MNIGQRNGSTRMNAKKHKRNSLSRLAVQSGSHGVTILISPPTRPSADQTGTSSGSSSGPGLSSQNAHHRTPLASQVNAPYAPRSKQRYVPAQTMLSPV